MQTSTIPWAITYDRKQQDHFTSWFIVKKSSMNPHGSTAKNLDEKQTDFDCSEVPQILQQKQQTAI